MIPLDDVFKAAKFIETKSKDRSDELTRRQWQRGKGEGKQQEKCDAHSLTKCTLPQTGPGHQLRNAA